MSNERPAIPQAVKRQVRQECYFGCVICGCPVFEYDHIEEFSVVKEHEVHNLALLCTMHHFMKSSRKLSAETVAEKRLKPFNQGKLFTSGYKLEGGKSVSVNLGGNQVEWDKTVGAPAHSCIWINGEHYLIIHLEEDGYTLSVNLTDSNGRTQLLVQEGELIVSADVGDYTYIGTTLTIKDKAGSTLLLVDLSDRGITVKKGLFVHPSGDAFVVEESELIAIKDGRVKGRWTGCLARNNGYGAFALYNRMHTPLDYADVPKGFAFKY